MAKAKKARRKVRRRTRARRNPTTVSKKPGRRGRVLTPEACSPRATQKIMHGRAKARKAHKRLPRRVGDCTFQSAELALQLGSKRGKRKPSRRKTARKPTKIRATNVTRTPKKGSSFAEKLDSASGVRKYYASARRTS